MSLGLETSRDSIFEVLVLVSVLKLRVLVLVLVLKGQCLGLGLGLGLEHLGFVTTPHAPNADLWAEVAKNDAFKSLHPLFEKIFSPPATSAPVERIFSHSGLLMRPNRARMGDKLLLQLVFLRCNNKL